MKLKACIGRKGAYFWDQETNNTYFVFTTKRDRSSEWLELYKTNVTQASSEYQTYALEFAKFCHKQKRRRDENKCADRMFPGYGTHYPGKFHVGNMLPEADSRWKSNNH
jgi:hypothetical protein